MQTKTLRASHTKSIQEKKRDQELNRDLNLPRENERERERDEERSLTTNAKYGVPNVKQGDIYKGKSRGTGFVRNNGNAPQVERKCQIATYAISSNQSLPRHCSNNTGRSGRELLMVDLFQQANWLAPRKGNM